MNGIDMVTALLACAGEATLWYALMQVGLLEKSDEGFPAPSIRPDPNHVAVISLGDSAPRLVYDADFGWLWYNSDGSELVVVPQGDDDPA